MTDRDAGKRGENRADKAGGFHAAPLPQGHPCAFANALLADGFVEDLVAAYDAIWNEKHQCVKAGDYDRALVLFRRQEGIIKELQAYCRRTAK